jgi:hypothetical protein
MAERRSPTRLTFSAEVTIDTRTSLGARFAQATLVHRENTSTVIYFDISQIRAALYGTEKLLAHNPEK